MGEPWGDLAQDTAVEQVGDGHYRASLSQAWEIWGPMGGYVAAVALRAAGAASPFARPASISVHYLGVGRFEPVDLQVEVLRVGRAAASHRVRMTQGDRAVLEALVWSVPETAGLDHEEPTFPAGIGPPASYPTPQERDPDGAPPFPFWENFEHRPLDWMVDWPPPGPLDALWQGWMRLQRWTPGADPWVDAARLVLLADLPSWPSANRVHAWKGHDFVAPTLDLQVSLAQLAPDEPWILVEGTSPVGADGLLPFTSRLWASDGRLVATGGGQCLCRSVPAP